MRISVKRFLLVLSTPISVACSDSLAPAELAGVYALQEVAGDSLPTLLFANESVVITIYADTLRLTADGRATLVRVTDLRQLATGDPPGAPARSESTLSFELVEDRIELTFPCPINANCAPSPHIIARRTPAGLHVEVSLGERVPQIFARIAAHP